MSAFQPISPRTALQLLEDANVGVDCAQLLADLAEAGAVRSYARLVEMSQPGQPAAETRDGRIERGLWKRIVAESKVADVFNVGSVRLGVAGAGANVLGIRFDAKSVRAAAAEHGPERPEIDRQKKPVVAPVIPEAPPVTAPAPAAEASPRRALSADAVGRSVDETAELLGLCRGTIYKMLDAGTLRSKKIGGRRVVSADSIRALMA